MIILHRRRTLALSTVPAISAIGPCVLLAGRSLRTPDGTRRLPTEYLDDGHVRHGYAVTVHKAQGVTCDHALLLGSDELYRESGHVGLSRGRESNRIYAVSTVPDPEAHIPKHLRNEREPLDLLTSALGQSRAQKLGIDHHAEPDVGASL